MTPRQQQDTATLRQRLRAVGPGILFAGAAIGVSHLVQSTRAGAGFGFTLLWAVVLVLFFKYPFFQFAHRYTVAAGESMLQGYRRLGHGALVVFMVIVVVSSFITTAAVTIVTAGLVGALLGLDVSLTWLSMGLLVLISVLLLVGRYGLLDMGMKVMVLVLGVLTLVAVGVAWKHGPVGDPAWQDPDIWSVGGITFLLALMGWMPAPLDISVWSSLWILEKHREDPTLPQRTGAMLDFNLGYGATVVLALAFVSFGALVMHGTGVKFSPSGLIFSQQLIHMYTNTLGAWTRPVIALVAFITMFSTTLTVLDGYARTLSSGLLLMVDGERALGKKLYPLFLLAQIIIAGLIINRFLGSMKTLVDIVTVLAFLAAPLVAGLNFRVMFLPTVPREQRPGRAMMIYCTAGMLFLVGFSLVWLKIRYF